MDPLALSGALHVLHGLGKLPWICTRQVPRLRARLIPWSVFVSAKVCSLRVWSLRLSW
jgi:hypothetical protein